MDNLFFSVGKDDYVLPLQAFVEVIANPKVSTREVSDHALCGTMIYAGQIIPVIPSPCRFGLRCDVNFDFVLIAKIGGKHMGLMVVGLAKRAPDAQEADKVQTAETVPVQA